MERIAPVEIPSAVEKGLLKPANEQAFKALVNAMPSLIWVADPQGGLTFCNSQWSHYTGMTEAEALGHGWISILHPDDMKACHIAWEQALREETTYKVEVRYRRYDGEYHWFLVQAQPMRDAAGNILAWYGTGINIADRKSVEELLQKSLEREQLIRKIVELTSQSFDIDRILQTVAEEVGRYMQADRCSVTRFSMIDGELVLNLSAQYWQEGLQPIDPGDINRIINAVRDLNPESMVEGKEQIINISDQAQYLEYLRARMESLPELPGLSTQALIDIVVKYEVLSSLRVNIYYRGIPYGSISLNQCKRTREWQPEEVTLLQAVADQIGSAIFQAELYQKEIMARQELEVYAQKLEASNRELEQFATIASHDLQEPLRKIKLFSEMLTQATPEESQEYLTRMQNSASRMQNLIHDLLTLSRVQRKGNPFTSLDLNEVLQTVLDDMQIAIQETNATIQADPLGHIRGDKIQIHQVFQNLISNALKYRKEGRLPIIRITGEYTDNEQCFQTTVEDNGIGIQPVYLHRIFEPFQRLHGVTKYPGTGMGLTICKKIIDRHQGTITVESTPGEGSRFTVRLPVHQG